MSNFNCQTHWALPFEYGHTHDLFLAFNTCILILKFRDDQYSQKAGIIKRFLKRSQIGMRVTKGRNLKDYSQNRLSRT